MKRLILLLISFVLLSCVHTDSNKYSKQVSIILREDDNKLIIEFCNKTKKEVFIPNYYLFDDTLLFNDYFQVLDRNKLKVEYLGIIGDFWLVDYISIPGEGSISRTVSLEDFYEINSNEWYKVQYSFSGLQSNCIDFILQE